MQRNSAHTLLLFFFIAFLIFQGPALTKAGPPVIVPLVESTYTSPSGKLRCDLDDFVSSPGFFVNEAYDSGESETLSFGWDAGSYFELWTIRRQRAGRVEFTPIGKGGFAVDNASFIPYFYSELPYEIESVATLEPLGGRSEVLRVQMAKQVQLHAYWLAQDGLWLNSIQFLPTLVDSAEDMLDVTAVKDALQKLTERCTFK
ncbi:hypothetical protein [Marinobacter sp.]|uniref:hypothetical protein n=1 Tax=Marinobacter sp. TaxID=50741 RepID=UPI00356969B4